VFARLPRPDGVGQVPARRLTIGVTASIESLNTVKYEKPQRSLGHAPGGGVGDGHRVGLVCCST
jgi:hypothetical protein